jgi:ribosome-binding factor A
VSAPRAERLAEQIRVESSEVLAREVHDPGVGFVTLTRVRVTADLQLARLYYTTMGDEAAPQGDGQGAAERDTPFVRRQLGARLQLRRVPEIEFTTTSRSPTRHGSRSCCRTSARPNPRRCPRIR